jgi:hypothetical protein
MNAESSRIGMQKSVFVAVKERHIKTNWPSETGIERGPQSVVVAEEDLEIDPWPARESAK